MMLVTTSLHNQKSRTGIDPTEHIQGANEAQKARLSVRSGARFVCAVITQIAAVPWQTQVLMGDLPCRAQTKVHTSVQQWTLSS